MLRSLPPRASHPAIIRAEAKGRVPLTLEDARVGCDVPALPRLYGLFKEEPSNATRIFTESICGYKSANAHPDSGTIRS